MAIPYRFEKILTIKHKEKEQVQLKYEQAVKHFESEATKLYELLKKKEMLEDQTEKELNNGLSIIGIKQQQLYRSALEKNINHAQVNVMKSRAKMMEEQELLVVQNVEVKKYEKMKEKDLKRYNAHLLSIDAKLMDDISLQQYMNRNV